MTEFSTWIQTNWYALGNLLAQAAFLAAGIWFARKVLRTMRASQEQVGALLKLSVTGSATERQSPVAVAERSLGGSPYWLAPEAERSSVSVLEAREKGPGRLATAGHRVMVWLETPMNSAHRPSPWRRAVKWLQAPAGS
jgi:hypothetical protein